MNKLLSDYIIYVLKRDNDNIENIIQNNSLLKQHRQVFRSLVKEITTNLSSTYVREKIRQGKSISYLTPVEVVTYILKNKLYQ